MFKYLQRLFAFNFLTLGVGEGAGTDVDKEAMEQLAGVVEKAVENATKELEEKYEAKLIEKTKLTDDLVEEVKKLKTSTYFSEAGKKELDIMYNEAVVSVFKEVNSKSSVSETEFQAIKKEIGTKVLAEGDITGGKAGLNVFAKFETDLIFELEQYNIFKVFKNITLSKGTKIIWTTATNGITATFVDEKGMPSESEPTFDTLSIEVKKIVALVAITKELQKDQMTAPQLYRLILDFSKEAIAELMEKEILSGDGTAFVGVFNLPGAKEFKLEAGKTVGDVTDNDILAIEEMLGDRDIRNGTWFMTRYILYQLLRVKDGNGHRLYPELRGKSPTLDGYPVKISPYAGEVKNTATNIAGKSFLAFGNPKQFLIVHRTGVDVAKGYIGDNFAREIDSIKVRKRGGMGSLKDSAFVIAKNGD